ncbi:MAG: hypothetical protein QOJ45_346 [Verrucomicrobiota bacterium]|jgi:hypothetical protein
MELTINPPFGAGGTLPVSRAWRASRTSRANEWVKVNSGDAGRKYLIKVPRNYPVASVQGSAVDTATAQIFEGLRQKWENETAIDSSVAKKSMHPAYQRIIGMGPDVIPLILRDLRRRRAHWFWALNAITGDSPADGESTVECAIDAWIRWGKDRGLI